MTQLATFLPPALRCPTEVWFEILANLVQARSGPGDVHEPAGRGALVTVSLVCSVLREFAQAALYKKVVLESRKTLLGWSKAPARQVTTQLTVRLKRGTLYRWDFGWVGRVLTAASEAKYVSPQVEPSIPHCALNALRKKPDVAQHALRSSPLSFLHLERLSLAIEEPFTLDSFPALPTVTDLCFVLWPVGITTFVPYFPALASLQLDTLTHTGRDFVDCNMGGLPPTPPSLTRFIATCCPSEGLLFRLPAGVREVAVRLSDPARLEYACVDRWSGSREWCLAQVAARLKRLVLLGCEDMAPGGSGGHPCVEALERAGVKVVFEKAARLEWPSLWSAA